jgi:hypothetical protein
VTHYEHFNGQAGLLNLYLDLIAPNKAIQEISPVLSSADFDFLIYGVLKESSLTEGDEHQISARTAHTQP